MSQSRARASQHFQVSKQEAHSIGVKNQSLSAERDALVFERTGLLTPRTVLAHGVHLQHEEFLLLKERGCAIASCPLSNFFFANGILKVKWLVHMGVKVRDEMQSLLRRDRSLWTNP